ncbi:MAG: hypothetical protein JEZ06_15555 [Anaerolineaceae bacterium]|nr:hypothetical protein [Anaerolineaceae bacterium]
MKVPWWESGTCFFCNNKWLVFVLLFLILSGGLSPLWWPKIFLPTPPIVLPDMETSEPAFTASNTAVEDRAILPTETSVSQNSSIINTIEPSATQTIASVQTEQRAVVIPTETNDPQTTTKPTTKPTTLTFTLPAAGLFSSTTELEIEEVPPNYQIQIIYRINIGDPDKTSFDIWGNGVGEDGHFTITGQNPYEFIFNSDRGGIYRIWFTNEDNQDAEIEIKVNHGLVNIN